MDSILDNQLVQDIDAAMSGANTAMVVAGVERALLQAMAERSMRLPDCVHAPIRDHYARRELYRSARHGYSIVAMTWGPGQGTPLHDHHGLWCVEGVWQGQLHITPYRKLEDRGQQSRFQPLPTLSGGPGSAGNLVPPDEFHVLRNASDDEVAISLHVYQRPLESCTVFTPCPDEPGWYGCSTQTMHTDAAATAC